MLKDLSLETVYYSAKHDLLNDFLIPCLKESCTYDRAAGYWSSNIFKIAAEGLSVFIENKGKIRLIVGTLTSMEDYEALAIGLNKDSIIEKYGHDFISNFDRFNDDLKNFRLDCLSWLIANNQLEIKVAFRSKGIFHIKDGILKDKNNDKIFFSGSGNDSQAAFATGFNYERLRIDRSWINHENIIIESEISVFEDLWQNRAKDTQVTPLANVAKEYFEHRASNINEKPTVAEEKRLIKNDYISLLKPKIPDEFEPFQHQQSALNNWKDENYQGIFELATGTGKTKTSIYGAVKMLEAKKRICLLIIVPYKNLADQWVEELNEFNINPIKCYETYQSWEEQLNDNIAKFSQETIDFMSIVVVKNTLTSKRFQNLLKIINPDTLMVIGDECHHYGSKVYNESLPKDAKYRIGLSATPYHYLNDDINLALDSYFNKVVKKFTLDEAINKGILCPYEYHIFPISLTPDEEDRYLEISKKIGMLFYSGNTDKSSFGAALAERARIIGNAENKIIKLNEILSNLKPSPYTLFYCAEGVVHDEFILENEIVEEESRQVDDVTELLYNLNWKSSRFTSSEITKSRKEILSNFKDKTIDALVAMKCLDEGIDIPLTKTAFIIASSANPRQHIQRRGRILRTHKDKEKATIYDFFVNLPVADESDKYSKRLITSELKRVNEFSKLALNHHETYNTLRPILINYGMEELLVTN